MQAVSEPPLERNRRSLFGWVVLAAFLLRLPGLGAWNFWYDEVLTFDESRLGFGDLLRALHDSESDKPPLYFLTLHGWLPATHAEFWARLPSALWSALASGFGALLASELLERRAARIAALFLVASPFLAWYGHEARPSALWTMWSAAALWLVVRFVREGGARHLVPAALCAALADYTFPYAIFLPAAAVLVALAGEPAVRTRRTASVAAAMAASLLLYLPWMLRVAGHGAPVVGVAKGAPWDSLGYTVYALGYGFTLGPSLGDLQAERKAWLAAHPLGTGTVALALVLLLAFAARGVWTLRRNRPALAAGLGGMAVFVGIPAAISFLKPSITFNPRYACPALFPLALLVGAGVAAAWKRGGWRRWGVAAFAGFLAWSLANFFGNPHYAKDDLRGAVRLLSAEGVRETVVCDGSLGLVVGHYAPGPKPIPFTAKPPEAFAAAAAELKEKLAGVRRFGVIYARPDIGDPAHRFPAWLKENYAVVREEALPGVRVFVVENPGPPAPAGR
ncbi:MAG TPA: glycosyltransferase family 39 protein [Candidatus Methylacidiphilales bacterium]